MASVHGAKGRLRDERVRDMERVAGNQHEVPWMHLLLRQARHAHMWQDKPHRGEQSRSSRVRELCKERRATRTASVREARGKSLLINIYY